MPSSRAVGSNPIHHPSPRVPCNRWGRWPSRSGAAARFAGAAAVLSLSGCGGGSSLLLPGDGVANHISIAAGNNQSGRVGEPLSDPLVAEVTDSRGRPVQGVSVAFSFTSSAPGAAFDPATTTTNAKGEAIAQVTLGTKIGAQTGEASIVTDGPSAPSTSFTLMAVSENANGIAVASGDDQTGKVGSPLRQPLVVQVTDAFGNPIAAVPIDWTVQGGGSVSEASNTTDENGLASVERTLGPATGKQTTQASSPGLAGSPATFTHTATAGSASSLTIVSGNNQTAKVGTRLPADLVVQLLDGDGNGVPSTAVTWVVGTGGGSVTPENGTTDQQGVATAQWTLGPNPGENRVDAVVSGVGIASFRASGTAAVPTTLTTTTTITGDSPDPSVSGRPFTVAVRVTAPGAVPTGTVSVTADGAAANCTATLQNGAGSCGLTLNRVGDRTLRATFAGGPRFKGSSATAPHRVNAPQPPPQQNHQPHADYNWTCDGLTCQFTDHSSDPDGDGTLASWSWNFGDGGTSQLRNPAHTFPGAGRYEVALTVTDNAGGSNTATAHVNVQGPPPPPANKAPHAEFEVHCTDQTCSFTDRSRDDDGTIAGRQWNFGDGQGSTDPNPTHTYAAPGRYPVTLTVTDNGGATDTRTHDANPSAPPPPPANKPPHAEFEVQCTDLTCSFTDRSTDDDGTIASRQWSFGDGQGSTDPNPTHTYSAPGTYHVTLTVTDNGGATDTRTHDANPTAPPPPPNQNPTANNDAASTPENTPVTINVLANDSDPDGDPLTPHIQNPPQDGKAVVNEDGTITYTPSSNFSGSDGFTYNVTDGRGGTSGSATVSITVTAVNSPPTAAFTFNCPDLSCTFDGRGSSDSDGSIAGWSWDFGDLTTDTSVPTPNHTYASDGTFTVTLTVTDNQGATGTTSNQVTVAAAPPPSSDGRISR